MPNHPHRSRRSPAAVSPDAIRAARLAAGLTQTEAGALCHRTLRAWQDAESGARSLDAAAWELFLLRTGTHPTHRLIARPAAS
jgi:DNA-binding transcriptional regulator YiaG